MNKINYSKFIEEESDDIKKFEIDGIKIYDNIFDILPEDIISQNIEKLKGSKLYGGNKEFPWLLINPNKIIDQSKVLNNYDFIKIHYKKKDIQYFIVNNNNVHVCIVCCV